MRNNEICQGKIEEIIDKCETCDGKEETCEEYKPILTSMSLGKIGRIIDYQNYAKIIGR